MRWITAADYFPGMSGMYLVCCVRHDEPAYVTIAHFDLRLGWQMVPYWRNNVTHWMELPRAT